MKANENSAWVKVFSGAAFETEVIKGLLEANDIRCILEDHTSMLISHYSNAGGYMCILVDPADKELALKLIQHKALLLKSNDTKV